MKDSLDRAEAYVFPPFPIIFSLSFFTEYSIPDGEAVYGRRLVSIARLHKWKEAPILPSRNIIAIVVVGQPNSTNLLITIYHLIRFNFRRFLPFGVLLVYLLYLCGVRLRLFMLVVVVVDRLVLVVWWYLLEQKVIHRDMRRREVAFLVLLMNRRRGRRVMDWLRRRTWMLWIGKHRSWRGLGLLQRKRQKGIEDGCGCGVRGQTSAGVYWYLVMYIFHMWSSGIILVLVFNSRCVIRFCF